MTINHCENCGGLYEYSPNDNALKCANCGTVKAIDSSKPIVYHPYTESAVNNNSWAKEVRREHCNSCGAEVIFNQYEISNQCPYCGSTSLENLKENNAMAPDAILPFALTKEEAKLYFKEGLKKKWFIPSCLKRKAPLYNLFPSYVGAYIFNGKVKANYSGSLQYTVTRRDKGGKTYTVTKIRNVSGVIDQPFQDWMYECSANLIQQDLVKIMPFYLQDRKVYSKEYLFGYVAEYTNTNVQEANKRFTAELTERLRSEILQKHDCDTILSLNLNYNFLEKNYHYCLLPSYVFSYKYKEKSYKTIMNGQTGKLGGGVPRSPVKITFFVLTILLIALGIILLCI